MKEEIAINIWFIVEIETGLSKYCIVRSYNLAGEDEVKTQVLRYLAETDYVTEKRIDYAENITINTPDGKEIKGYVPKENINYVFEMYVDHFLNIAERKLPAIPQIITDNNGRVGKSTRRFPESPLYVITMLMENEHGEMRPYSTPANMEWYEAERKRIDNNTK